LLALKEATMSQATPAPLDVYWEAVQQRDPAYDGAFVYAVRTTGVYCRPTCPSRRPHRHNVEFFEQMDAAEAAGYRPCQRCTPRQPDQPEPLAETVIAVCRYLEGEHESAPTLDDLAARFNVSPYHLQRTFKRLVGVSPRQYADAHRRDRLKAGLRAGRAVTEAVYDAGYGGSSSFYEGAGAALGMSPVVYREGGRDVNVNYTVVPCKLGYLLVGATERGVCAIRLADSADAARDELLREFPRATVAPASDSLDGWVSAVVAYINGEATRIDLPLDIQATAFQRKVWEALRAIPYGSTRTYSQVAEAIGQPTAARAVAAACAHNPVAMAVPCHRVVRAGGDLSGYRWGVARKRALLRQEAAAG
jgi:AraC family transcriptional regulator of adaptative response/methylated-DNA-[protein]-cysteine methyltransferase